jgi:hypothetical protein
MQRVLGREASFATLFMLFATLLVPFTTLSGCRQRDESTARASKSTSADLFVDRAKEVGLDFDHDAGRAGKFYFPEIQGAGATFVDHDADGDLDAFVVQSGSVDDPGTSTDGKGPALGRLYRNDLVAGANSSWARTVPRSASRT